MAGMSLLVEGTAALGLTLTAEQLAHFARYQELLIEWNERINLTAIVEPEAIQVRHFLDSLSCVRVMGDLNGRQLIDVGTGAGFPGLPLKIFYPQLRLTLVESVMKKTYFLQAVTSELGLKDVTILSERAETLGQQPAHRDQYDWAVARGVAEMRVLVEYLLPLCRHGGRMLAQKGDNANGEVAAAVPAINQLGGALPHLYPVQLLNVVDTHYLVVIEKIGPTPARYPRRPGMAAKRPL